MAKHAVLVYTTPSCVYCRMAKDFFTDNHVTYTEHNVASDLAKRQEMIQKSGQMGVPVISIDDQVVVGFDEEKLKTLLEI